MIMWKSIKKIAELLAPRQRWQAISLVVLMLGQALLEMAGVGLIPAYLGILVEPERLLDFEATGQILGIVGLSPEQLTQETLLYLGSASIIALFTFKLIYGPIVVYLRARLVQGIAQSLGNRLLKGYVYAPYQFHIQRNSAELIRNVTNEAMLIGPTVLRPILGVIGNGLISLAIAMLLVVTAPGVGLLTLAVSGVVVVTVAKVLGGRTRRIAKEAQAGRQRVLAASQEVLNGIKELKLLGREASFLGRFRRSLRKIMELFRFVEVVSKVQPLLLEWVVVITLMILILSLFLSGASTGSLVGTAALFALASVRLKTSVGALVNDHANFRAGIVTLDVIYEELKLLETLPGRSEPSQGKTEPQPLKFANDITLDDVWFRYEGSEKYALRGASLSIRRGEAVGLVGPSGSGKSTLVDIILGLFTPEKGAVRVDGVDLRQCLPSWHRVLGYIPQSIFLIDGTIRQNIALGLLDKEIDEQAIQRAVNVASLRELVQSLPQGLDTMVGEGGARLSGGQRQRIVIARALYHDPQVLIMDEATSALDNLTERAVMEAVNKLKGERTIVLIAHRISTVRNMDRIVYMQDGEIEAVGGYDELATKHAGFRKMAGHL
jgi:ATP-binding cassette subfamily C protein